jgi:REP element-mobilizing transposase RayT
MGLLAAGGANDHVHLLVRVPTTVTIAKCVQSIKAVSSKWVHETFSNFAGFAWQEGYGAFSVGISQVDETVAYIESQEEHHRRHTFEEELISFLKKHDIEYDPRFVFG